MSTSMTKGSPLKLMLQFALPLLMGNLLQQFLIFLIVNQLVHHCRAHPFRIPEEIHVKAVLQIRLLAAFQDLIADSAQRSAIQIFPVPGVQINHRRHPLPLLPDGKSVHDDPVIFLQRDHL